MAFLPKSLLPKEYRLGDIRTASSPLLPNTWPFLCWHILCPETGLPVETDAAGATVIARRSLDAEGYSTTLLALGIERGRAFAQSHPAIMEAHFVDAEGKVHSA